MENVYRRESSRERKVEHIGKSEKFSMKRLMTGQSIICIIILIGAMSVNFSPEGAMKFEKNAIRFILTHDMDFERIPSDIRGFVEKYIFDKKSETKGKEALLDMVSPLSGNFESPFGLRLHPTENIEKFHYGVDISAPIGEKIVCSQNGVAKEVNTSSEYGNYIIVDHGDDIFTLYAHCSEIIAKTGDEIKAGQMIAKVGDTGDVTGAHLHFEIRDGENWLDPAEFIDFK